MHRPAPTGGPFRLALHLMEPMPDHAQTLASRLRIVLVRPSHPGNIGAAARAMRTMGLTRMNLVAPHAFPHPEAVALAAGATDVLDAAVVTDTLPAAIADCRLVLGATARRRGVPLPELDPHAAARVALDAVGEGAEVALVFGNERTGLENEELICCHQAITIPSDPAFSSLNLAQAVQVIAYELRMALPGRVSPAAPVSPAAGDPPASSEQMEGFYAHLAQTLTDIDFHKGRSDRTIMQRLRRLFQRAEPDQRELRILRGILGEAQRMARIAREGK